jgi:ribosome-interacting GTPase 1
MAVNLPPQYHDAEAEYKKARTPEEKLAALKKMWVILPKHKASEKVQSQLKTKIADLNDEIEHKASGPKKSGSAYKIPRQGAGQYVFLGAPNAGKSRLLSRLTKATPEVAAYPFTTREPIPGMMDFEDVRLQLIDLPPITSDFFEPFVGDFTRVADAAVLLVDLADDDCPFATEAVIDRLKAAKRLLVGEIPEGEEDPTVWYVKTLMVCNKIDADGADDRLAFIQDMFATKFPILTISAERGDGLDELKKRLYEHLDIIRVYAKQPGKPSDMTAPFTIPRGGTVLDFAEKVHTDFAESLKSARVWGSAEFDGQTVKRDHVLADKDVVELHA